MTVSAKAELKGNPVLIVILSGLLCYGLSDLISHSATAALLMPISTPPNALAYSTNLIQQKDMIRVGIIVGALGLILGYIVLFVASTLHII